MLEFWKKVKPFLPPGWASHDYLGDALRVGHREDGAGLHVGPHRRLHRPVRPARQAEPRRLPDVAEDHRAPWARRRSPSSTTSRGCSTRTPRRTRRRPPKEFLKFFFKNENYRRYCDSVPVHLLSIFKDDFQDSGLHGASRAQALEALARRAAQVGGDRPRASAPRLQPSGHAGAVDRRRRGGAHPGRHGHGGGGAREGSRAAAKEASDKISRDIIGKAK